MNKVISILGCGWLGFPLSDHLRTLGYQVKGSTTSAHKIAKLQSIGIQAYSIDLKAAAPRYDDFLDTEVLIITLPATQLAYFDKLLKNISPSVKIIYTSTTSVYLPSEYPIDENGILDEKSPHLLIEKLLKINQNTTTILRLAGLFNAERHPGKWFANKVLSNPNAPVNLIHLDDCIGIIEQVIKKNIWEQTFNACTDEHPSRKDFYTRATQVIGQQIREVLDTSTLSKLIDNKLLKNTLDYHFKISLNAFLQDYEIS